MKGSMTPWQSGSATYDGVMVMPGSARLCREAEDVNLLTAWPELLRWWGEAHGISTRWGSNGGFDAPTKPTEPGWAVRR
jgi:hypothetical protein